jgi:hypothetical protein
MTENEQLSARRSHAADLLLDRVAVLGAAGQGPVPSSFPAGGLSTGAHSLVSQAELDAIFDSASLVRELQTGWKEALGRFDERALAWDISVPWIDRRAQALVQRAGKAGAPGGFRVIMTHDVDRTTGFEPTALLNSFLKAGGLRRSACLGLRDTCSPRALVRNVERLLEYEQAHGVGACYFMMAGPYGRGRYATRTDIRWRASREIVRLVQQAGMSIGLHGSFYARERNTYAEEKQRVEQVLGCALRAHRNHYLRFDPERLPAQMEAAGLEYDFSMGFRTRVGFRTGCAHVHRAYDLLNHRTSSLRLVPLVFMDTVLCDGEPAARLAELHSVLQQTREVGGCVSLLFHPETLIEQRDGWTWFERTVGMCAELGADLSGVLP